MALLEIRPVQPPGQEALPGVDKAYARAVLGEKATVVSLSKPGKFTATYGSSVAHDIAILPINGSVRRWEPDKGRQDKEIPDLPNQETLFT